MSDQTLGKAYVQIVPSAEGITGKIKNALGPSMPQAGQQAGGSMGLAMVSKMKGIIAAAGIGTVVGKALKEGANIEQSFGGLDTIYGKASEQAKKFAVEASKMGISANDYAEQAVSFGASLKQAFGGDTTKAVNAANIAIADMTDNAAKMGTPIESIQTAYQGFAKGQYQLLDNLKLGYGGTKTEMERLLADAGKLTGKKYDRGNLGDVYDAIHAIQGDLGLTGVAANEAAETFSGSFGAMKASASNLLGILMTGGDINNAVSALITNASNFAFGNLIPALQRIVVAIPPMIGAFLTQGLPMLASNILKLIPSLLTTVAQVITGVANAITKGINKIANGKGLSENGKKAIVNFAKGIIAALPQIAIAMAKLVGAVLKGVLTLPSKLLKAGKDAITSFVKGLKSSVHIPKLHITWSTDSKEGSNGSLIKIPKPTLSWYKTGGIFSQPSVIGVGEAGSEAVVPLDKFWNKMDAMAQNQGGGLLNVVITLDGQTIGQSAVDYINGQTLQFNASPLAL